MSNPLTCILPHGRGDGFNYFAEWLPEPNAPATLEFVDLASQVRTIAGVLVADVTITKAPDFMGFTCSVPNTSTWPIGQLEWDIKATFSGVVVHSQKILISVLKTVTE